MPTESNTPANRYGSIAAEVYDLDKPVGGTLYTPFHLERLETVSGPILEPACGSGRFLIPLLEAGREVIGFDASAEMLERCLARCAERGLSADLSLQCWEDFHYDRTFSAVVVPVASFNLIHDFAAAVSVLGRFRDHLAVGGLLMVDVQPLSALSTRGDDRRSWTAENGDLLTCDGRRQEIDWLEQRERYHTRYERWRDNRLIESQLEPMALRYWGIEELTMVLRDTGFGQIAVIGNYDRRRPPRSGDQILTFEAVRL
jgi:SAM-dependent methyltransferase